MRYFSTAFEYQIEIPSERNSDIRTIASERVLFQNNACAWDILLRGELNFGNINPRVSTGRRAG